MTVVVVDDFPGVVENNYGAVEAYLSCGGNPGRSLTSTEVSLLNRNSAYDVGHTLIHLAIRFHREEMLPMLLAQISGGPGMESCFFFLPFFSFENRTSQLVF